MFTSRQNSRTGIPSFRGFHAMLGFGPRGGARAEVFMSALPELTNLGAATFQHLVNALAIHVLGPGITSFAPGPDGGRDCLFEGEAPYPSVTERWRGRWYIQSKHLSPHVSRDEHK